MSAKLFPIFGKHNFITFLPNLPFLNISKRRPAIFLFGFFVAVAAVVVLFVDLDFKLPNNNLRRDIKTLIKNIELDAFFIISLVSGKLLLKMHFHF